MKYERWLIPETDDAAVEALMDAGYPYLVSTVLASRGVVTPEQAAAHLDRERSLVYSPFLMRDMDKAWYPAKTIVPSTEIVQDRTTLELFRGCIRGCRFCQAGYVYRPCLLYTSPSPRD